MESRTVKRILAILLRVSVLLLSSTGALAQADKAAGERSEALRLVDAWLDAQQAYGHIPAVSAGVVVGDDLVWSKGYGTIDAQHTVPASPKTIYSICSISKLFTSVALMEQYDVGKVRLDDPITTYIPWAKLKPLSEDSGPVTVRGILSHSAGLPRESDSPYWSAPDFKFPSHDEIQKKIAEQTALYPAERYFQYSNLGLTLAGEIVAAVAKEPYAQYAQAHVLDPLKLSDTRPYYPKDLVGKQMAVGYSALKRDGTRDLLPPFDTKGIAPAAGYTSTVEDLAKFASWQFRLLRTGQASLLKPSTLYEMQRVQFMDPNWKTSWGLGFAVNRRADKTYVGHGGSCPGYRTALTMRNADQIGVIVLMNAMENPGEEAEGVYTILDKRKGYEFKDPAPATAVKLEDYVGHYSTQPWGSELVITPWAGGLVLLDLPTDKPGDDMTFLKPKGGDLFRRVRDDGSEAEEFQFKRDASGKVTSLLHFSNSTMRLADK
jgi:CubicO group peptidase (beta-lactamase class C family)